MSVGQRSSLSHHHLCPVGKRPNSSNTTSPEIPIGRGNEAMVWILLDSLQKLYRRHNKVIRPSKAVAEVATVVSVSSLQTFLKYAQSFHQTFQGSYFRKGTSSRQRLPEMIRAALQKEAGYSIKACSVLKKSTYWHNPGQKLNINQVRTLNRRASPPKNVILKGRDLWSTPFTYWSNNKSELQHDKEGK